MLNGRSKKSLEDLKKEIIKSGGACETAVFDIQDDIAVSNYFKKNEDKPIHGLVNNAYSGGSGSLMTSEDDEYANAYDVSVVAAQRLIKKVAPSMMLAHEDNQNPSIVNIASMYGLVSPDINIYQDKSSANPPFYGAAKAALIQLTKYSACELGNKGIRVNSISPGAFPSEDTQKKHPELIKKLIKKIPLRTVGQPIEVASAVVFLLSNGASFINGENLVIDGGWTSL